MQNFPDVETLIAVPPFEIAPPLPLFVSLYAIVVARYFLFAGGLYWLVCRRSEGGRWPRARRIHPRGPDPGQIRREIGWSLVSSLFFAAGGVVLLRAWADGHSLLYWEPLRYGAWWLPASFGVLALLHETYFYWTHRWMHRPRLFTLMHRTHHESRRPTPFASFSFSPWEALVQAAILPAFTFLLPIHIGVLLAFLTFMTILGVVNHLGYELYPRGFAEHPFFKWWISATHHQAHHERVSINYGLYFTFWDHWMRTQWPPFAVRAPSSEARKVPS